MTRKRNAKRVKGSISWSKGLVFLALVAIAGGCRVGPEYHPPSMPVPEEWHGPQPHDGDQGNCDPYCCCWWEEFQDPVLQMLVEEGLDCNLDLELACARIVEAHALRRASLAAYGPTVNWVTSYTHQYLDQFDVLPGAPPSLAASLGLGRRRDILDTHLDSVWNLDVFGRTTRQVQAFTADMEALREDERNIRVLLIADIATSYLDLRGFQAQLSITQETLESQRKTAQYVQDRYEAGLAGRLDLDQAQGQVGLTMSRLSIFQIGIDRSIHRLSVLLGRCPDVLYPDLKGEAPIPTVLPQVSMGIPCDLLRRRPDIRKAERQLAAATYRTGAAIADLFPRLDLFSAAGYKNGGWTDWISCGSEFYTVNPQVMLPILDWGRLQSNVKAQKARQKQACITYQKTVLLALEEVENSLVAYHFEKQRHKALTDAVEAFRKAQADAIELYRQGATDFLSVLDAQRTLFNAMLSLAQSQQALAQDMVLLYKALGGGWYCTETMACP